MEACEELDGDGGGCPEAAALNARTRCVFPNFDLALKACHLLLPFSSSLFALAITLAMGGQGAEKLQTL